MPTLVYAALSIRKAARSSFGLGAAVALAILVLLGVFRTPVDGLGLEHVVVGTAFCAIFGHRFHKRVRAKRGSQLFLEFELGVLLLVALQAVLQMGGGLAGPYYPAVYILIAFLSSFTRSPVGSLIVLFAIAFEAVLWWLAEPIAEWNTFALHAVFMALFGSLNLVFTKAEIARVRQRSRRELTEEKEKVREDARVFRLAGAPSMNTDARNTDKLFQSSVDQVHNALYHVLDLLKRTLGLHTCILLMRTDEDKLQIVELATDSEQISEGPFKLGSGAVGAVAMRGLVMNLENLRPGYKGICYYRDGAYVRAFLGVPLFEGDKICGALCADRKDDRPFSPTEEETLRGSIEQIKRTIQNERVFIQLERSKAEQTCLYRASQALGEALTEHEVIDAGLNAAASIAPFDFGAITRFDVKTSKHTVLRAIGEDEKAFVGLTFRDNNSLTAMAVKNRHYLPYRGEFDPRQQVVFTRRRKLQGMSSLLILPLVVRENAIGTLLVAAQRPHAFNETVRPTLEVLANQLAVALSNAAAVRRLEEMATTDGLTGCLNKRTFLEELRAKIRSAARFNRKLSLLVTDIDHFKNVNDTYGHATGDVVIKELGALLKRVKRETDSVARFGGEEFCVLCEETDTKGAVALAERIRQELGSTVFNTELGNLSVTCSIGVATFPIDSKTPDQLFEITDKALYAAKHGGRNQVCTSVDL